MKWTRQQYLDMMTYNSPSRPMFSELFGPIITKWALTQAGDITPKPDYVKNRRKIKLEQAKNHR